MTKLAWQSKDVNHSCGKFACKIHSVKMLFSFVKISESALLDL